jgi:hypothetical protein
VERMHISHWSMLQNLSEEKIQHVKYTTENVRYI